MNEGPSRPLTLLQALKALQDTDAQMRILDIRRRLLRKRIRLCLARGESTADTMLDFVLSVCGGEHDPHILRKYKRLRSIFSEPFRSLVLVVQCAHCEVGGRIEQIRRVYIACVRHGDIVYDTEKGLMHLPVMPRFYTRWETLSMDGQTRYEYEEVVVTRNVITLGPLTSKYNHPLYALPRGETGACGVPEGSCFEIVYHPFSASVVQEKLSLTETQIHTYMHAWTKLNSSL